MPDIEAVAEPSPCETRPLPNPHPVELWLLVQWIDDRNHTEGGFWISGGSWLTREDAMVYSIRDPRRERIVHIVEPK